MEIVAFLVAVVGLLVFVLVRRRRDDDPEAGYLDMEHDLRDKNTGMISLPNRGRAWPNPPVSRSGGGTVFGGGGGGAGNAGGAGDGGGGGF
jgi:hypothetical protein